MQVHKYQVAIVTGAASGIGRKVALRLAEQGVKLVVSDVREAPDSLGFEHDKTLSTAEKICALGGDAIFVPCDVSDPNQVQNLVTAAIARYGRLDLACNNAGVALPGGRLDQREYKDLHKIMDVNFWGVVHCCREEIRAMLDQHEGGRIVNISSIAATRGCAGQAEYCASKGAVAAFSRALAVDYGPCGIHVNCVAPGWIGTAMQNFPSAEKRSAAYIQDTPDRRLGRAGDVADAVCFLLSSGADYVNGHELIVDGGNTVVWDSYPSLEETYQAYPGY